LPFTIDPSRITSQDCPYELADRLRLLGGAILIAAVRDRKKMEARSADRPGALDDLLREPVL
jgi:hypothetical protein